jgi:hypothetical protein
MDDPMGPAMLMCLYADGEGKDPGLKGEDGGVAPGEGIGEDGGGRVSLNQVFETMFVSSEEWAQLASTLRVIHVYLFFG